MRFWRESESTFRLDIDPSCLTTAQEKGVRIVKAKNGKMFPTFFKKKRSLENEKLISNELKKKIVGWKTVQNDGDTAVNLRIVYMFPHPSGTPKWRRSETTFMTQRPDADNVSKALVDCMTKAGLWEDDSMVNFNFSKYRAPDPHIIVIVSVWKQERENPK